MLFRGFPRRAPGAMGALNVKMAPYIKGQGARLRHKNWNKALINFKIYPSLTKYSFKPYRKPKNHAQRRSSVFQTDFIST